MKDGTMKTCAEKYKVQAALIEEVKNKDGAVRTWNL